MQSFVVWVIIVLKHQLCPALGRAVVIKMDPARDVVLRRALIALKSNVVKGEFA